MLDGDAYVLVFDVETQEVERAHIDVGDPYQSEPSDEVAAPAGVEQLEPDDEEYERSDVVREAVLAGEEVEEFSLRQRATVLAFALAVLAGLAEDFFVRYRP